MAIVKKKKVSAASKAATEKPEVKKAVKRPVAVSFCTKHSRRSSNFLGNRGSDSKEEEASEKGEEIGEKGS